MNAPNSLNHMKESNSISKRDLKTCGQVFLRTSRIIFAVRCIVAAIVLVPLTVAFTALADTYPPPAIVDGQVVVVPGKIQSLLELESSSTQFVDVFNWAKTQALAYAHDDGDPVGPWCEAVEPGREGFCVRDMCHQSLGAQALGLARFNLNMLRHFAEGISDSKDWCSYWEINRFNEPCPVDYENDTAFWYNLPANFDLLDTCFKMYVWTGDRTYINDPVFLNFYDRTVNDYVQRWGIGVDQVMTRPRLLNVRGILSTNRFQHARGIPSYNEANHSFVVGFDVLVTERAAFLADANIQQVRKNWELSEELMNKAAAVENLITTVWWDKTNHYFYQRLSEDYQLEGRGRTNINLSSDWHLDVTSDSGGFARPDDFNASMGRLLNLNRGNLQYPEVAFTRIGDIVRDAFGIGLEFNPPQNSTRQGGWVEVTLQTMSGLGTNVDWAELRNLPIRDNRVTIRHDGMTKTTLTNQSGPALIWFAKFIGRHPKALVNGRPFNAKIELDDLGRYISTVRVIMGAGGTATVEVSNDEGTATL